MNNIILPELVQKNISEFLEPINKSCTIRIQQNAGCVKGEHSVYRINDRCSYCSKRYLPGQIFFYLTKGGDKHLFEKWLTETKDPISSINETLKDSVEAIKKLPNLPEVMDKANQALTFLASGQIPQNSNSYNELNIKKSEMITFRNQTIIGLLLLVIAGLLVF